MDYHGRQNSLQSVLASHHLDGLLVTHLPNIRYLCGFTGSSAALLVTEGQSVFFTDGRYTEQAHAEVRGSKILISRNAALTAAGEWLAGKAKKLRLKTLGVEAEHMSVAERSRLAKSLGSSVRLREAPPLVEQARIVKDHQEIERLREIGRAHV